MENKFREGKSMKEMNKWKIYEIGKERQGSKVIDFIYLFHEFKRVFISFKRMP